MVDFIRAGGDHNDPVRFLETRIGPTRQALERSTDGCLDKIEAAAFKYSNDPLLEFLAARWYFAWSRGPFLDEWVRVDTERPRTPPPMPLPLLDCAKE
jgi:hypothetical protein